MLKEEERMFYREAQGMEKKKGKVPEITKFEELWAGIWGDESNTYHRKWMNTIAQKIKVVDKGCRSPRFPITEEKMHDTIEKRKKWSAQLSTEYRILGGRN